MAELLQIKDLEVSVEEKKILKGINLTINKGEIHVVMGTNGAGKSTLANAIMGNPLYTVDKGSIVFDGKDITEDAVNDRAKAGIFMSFQSPISVPGITVENFIRTAKSTIIIHSYLNDSKIFLLKYTGIRKNPYISVYLIVY